MATVTKRGDSYRIRVSAGYDVNGKQIVKSMTWKPEPGMTKKQIEKELERQKVLFEEKVNSGQASDSNVKFEALAREWLAQTEKAGNMKTSSLERLKGCQARTYAAIGHLYVTKITMRQIQSFINNLAEDGINQQTGGGLSTKSQKHYLNFISDVFRYAIQCGIVNDNPCRNVSTVKFEPSQREVYTIEEEKKILKNLKNAPSKYRVFLMLAVFGGFRRGEILGFEWKDIDFDSGVISVVRTSSYQNKSTGVYTTSPKTKSSRRSIRLPDELINELKQYKTEQTRQRLQLGDMWHDSDRLFTQEDGKPMHTNTVYVWLKKFCERNDIPFKGIHAFRHSFATEIIQSGEVDIKTVSAVLGHSQTSTTLNIYAHACEQANARAVDVISDLLGSEAKKA